MTREDCERIMRNIEKIKRFAEGGDLEFPYFNVDGKFLGWDSKYSNTILISCLDAYKLNRNKKGTKK